MEQALANASEWPGPIVVHVMTQKGRGYAPAEEDDIQRLHDVKVTVAADRRPAGRRPVPVDGRPTASERRRRHRRCPSDGHDVAAELPVTTFTDAFTRSLLRHAEADPRIVAITAAMPGPTGLLPFEARFPDRFVDVGIAEQHAVTAAAGMAMAGMRPVVAVYSTFFSRAFDQANLDVGLHRLPVVLVLDRAGITGDDGPSHHGVLDMALGLSIPGMTVFAPSSAPEVEVMLAEALTLDGPSMIRFPKTPAPWVAPGTVGIGPARPQRAGRGRLGVHPGRGEDGHRRRGGGRASSRPRGSTSTVWDVRVVSDPDPAMVADAARHRRGDHGRGRRAPGWGRHVPGRCRCGSRAARARPRRSSPSGSPAPTSPRASPTASWPDWAWTAPGWPGRSGRPRAARTGPATGEPARRRPGHRPGRPR